MLNVEAVLFLCTMMYRLSLKRPVLAAVFALSAFTLTSCDVLLAVAETYLEDLPLTEEEAGAGLKEALKVGVTNAVTQSSTEDGFWGNEALRIPWPEDAMKVKNTLNKLGMTALTEKFEEQMNHAAEEATKEAAPIFVNAITTMTVKYAMGILGGGNTAATTYLKSTTQDELEKAFEPIITSAMQKNKVDEVWSDLATRYNKLPLVKPVETDLPSYITHGAVEGLFKLVAEEEKEIRENPQARITDTLQKVFGSPEANK